MMGFRVFIPSLVFILVAGITFILLQFAFHVHGIVLKVLIAILVGAVSA